MPENTYDVPNISAPKEFNFTVELIHHRLFDPAIENKDLAATRLAVQLGGTENCSSTDTRSMHRTISFIFRTYLEALAFSDAAASLGFYRLKEIMYQADLPGEDNKELCVILHPRPRLI